MNDRFAGRNHNGFATKQGRKISAKAPKSTTGQNCPLVYDQERYRILHEFINKKGSTLRPFGGEALKTRTARHSYVT